MGETNGKTLDELTAEDALAIFEATCEAAGVTRGVERISVFLELPVNVQERIWADAKGRLAVMVGRRDS